VHRIAPSLIKAARRDAGAILLLLEILLPLES